MCRVHQQVMALVKDTHREFEELLSAVASSTGDDEEQFDDEDDFGDDSYSAEEKPYVEACLVLMKGSFNMLRLVAEVMGEVCENVPIASSETSTTHPTESSLVNTSAHDNQFVAELYRISLQLRNTANDLGMEMYAPLDIATLQNQFVASKGDVVAIIRKVESYTAALERSGPTVEKMRNILQNIELQSLCFASLGGTYADYAW